MPSTGSSSVGVTTASSQRQARLGRHRSLGAKVAELAAILDEDGYLASYEQLGRDHYVVVEHNCAIAAVANRYGQACTSEIDFIRAVLPEADVTRISHMVERRPALRLRHPPEALTPAKRFPARVARGRIASSAWAV